MTADAVAQPVTAAPSPGPPAAKVHGLREPSDETYQLAARASKRAHARATPVRIRFIERAQAEDPPPPLARLLRGGRGGEVRLKVLLALLWLGSGGDHVVRFPAHSFAGLLGLPDRYVNGARRVNDALNWLRDHDFIAIQRVPGREPKITLRSELGTGDPYVVPARAPKNPTTGKATADNVYVQLPVSYWTRGWAVKLSGSATAMLLVLLLLERSARGRPAERELEQPGVWVSPDEAVRRFDLSEDTRSRGFGELRRHGLVLVARQPVNADFGWRRVRNVYTLFQPVMDMDLTKIGDADMSSQGRSATPRPMEASP
jgi:hypothetical protein